MEEDLTLTEAADLIKYLQAQVKVLENKITDWEKKYSDETITIQVSAKLWDQINAKLEALIAENNELKEELNKLHATPEE